VSSFKVDVCCSFAEAFFTKLACTAKCYIDEDSQMCAGDDGRLEGCLLRAHRQRLCNDRFKDWVVPFGLVNISQNDDFARASFECFPTFTRRYKLYDIVSERLVSRKVLWAAQGFPHPGLACLPEELRRLFPFPSLVQEALAHGPVEEPGSQQTVLGDGAQRALMGNSMHLAQITAWLCFCLSVSRPLF
jgi:hypothetical protein